MLLPSPSLQRARLQRSRFGPLGFAAFLEALSGRTPTVPRHVPDGCMACKGQANDAAPGAGEVQNGPAAESRSNCISRWLAGRCEGVSRCCRGGCLH